MTEALHQVRITGLFRYPVKSCRGHAVDRVTLDAQGIRHDRRFMVVRAEDGMFLTQREFPRMARIVPAVTPEDTLTLTAPGMSSLTAPLLKITNDVSRVGVTIWKDSVIATDMGAAAARWLTDYLETPCRLVYAPEDFDRPVNPKYAQPDDKVGFADGYPVLLASEASLADLNARIAANGGEPVAMERFRPNIVVAGEGLPPFAEDGWRRLTVRESGASLRSAKPCARCLMITLDAQTGESLGPEPLKTLATYRRQEDGKVLFAQNLIPDNKTPVTLKVGDILEVE